MRPRAAWLPGGTAGCRRPAAWVDHRQPAATHYVRARLAPAPSCPLDPRPRRPASPLRPPPGIEEQIARLSEIESLQEEWQLQAEAQDEVERLLRSQAI